jgi:hypothetical protein
VKWREVSGIDPHFLKSLSKGACDGILVSIECPSGEPPGVTVMTPRSSMLEKHEEFLAPSTHC